MYKASSDINISTSLSWTNTRLLSRGYLAITVMGFEGT